MTIDGIWTSEVYGPYGWEHRGVFIFENGRVMGGDERQYSAGTYATNGGTVTADIVVHNYASPRAEFGEIREEFRTRLEGCLNTSTIEGYVRRPDKPQFDLQLRLIRRMDLPD